MGIKIGVDGGGSKTEIVALICSLEQDQSDTAHIEL
jgi:N-acetylglucosamine kinase-like BadF-type ATPase